MSILKKLFCGLLILVALAGCDKRDWERLTNSIGEPSPQTIDKSIVGVNNFFVYNEFGSVQEQYADIKNNLGLKYVRVLFAWADSVQGSPDDLAFVGFYDDILDKAPAGVDVLIVVAHTPSWMANPANWIDGNPRKTFVQRWLKPLVQRYSSNPRVVGFEIWNEPDLTVVGSDAALGLEEPENYFEMLQMGSQVVRQYAPGKRVVIAATESINQSFPNHLNYNKKLRDLGAESLVDVWNVHYYGKNYDTVAVTDGVAEFIDELSVPTWVTESGYKGPIGQLDYAERTWPFLRDEAPTIERVYYYEYASPVTPVDDNYGLRTTSSVNPISDLYVWLRDN